MYHLAPIHKFIMRNLGILSLSQIATYLGVTSETVRGLADDLGLPEMEVLPIERALPLIVRRNHDLLSEESVARLIGMSLEEYRHAILDMDFLDAKVGTRTPNIPEINASDFDKTIAADFRTNNSQFLADYAEWEKPFSFLSEMYQKEVWPADSTMNTGDHLNLRIMYSYTGTHGDFLLQGEDFYNDGILSRLQHRGVNGGWMPILLRDMAPTKIFKPFGKDCEIRLENLRKQVEKAARYGIRIYPYLNEPRFLPGEFFEEYPEARGNESPNQKGYYGMCTSSSMVREWMYESVKHILTEVPDLGGFVLISASENKTHCCSHPATEDIPACPKCEKRGIGQVLADPANIVNEAAKSVGSSINILQWLWSWDWVLPPDQVKDEIANLAPEVQIMVDWAKRTPFMLFGKEAIIREYTLAYTKPSDYALGIISNARKQGRKVNARASIVTTIEANALPYLPVMRNEENLLKELQSHEIDGILGCWIFGGYPGRNMEMLSVSGEESPTKSLAEKYYGSGAEHALEAWNTFSDGMKYFPTTLEVLYASGLTSGPGLQLSLEPQPWRDGMVALVTEDIGWVSDPFGPEVMIRGFREVAKYFKEGLKHLKLAIETSDREQYREDNAKDYGICEAEMHHLLSGANYSEFIIVRNQWLSEPDNSEAKQRMISIMKDELQNTEEMLELIKTDSRMGYEGSVGYFYTPVELVEKIHAIKCDIEKLANS